MSTIMNEGLMYIITSPNSHDPSGLCELAHRASRYSVVLDGLVSGDNIRLRGGYALVRSGTLYPSGVVAVAPGGSGLPRDARTTKVRSLTNRRYLSLL